MSRAPFSRPRRILVQSPFYLQRADVVNSHVVLPGHGKPILPPALVHEEDVGPTLGAVGEVNQGCLREEADRQKSWRSQRKLERVGDYTKNYW